jgi:hypothetical protein
LQRAAFQKYSSSPATRPKQTPLAATFFLNQLRVLIGANHPQESHRDDEQNTIKENHQFFLLCAK